METSAPVKTSGTTLIAILRGTFVAILAFLYGVFAWGIYVGRDWAPPLGIAVVIVNLLLVLSVVIQGEELLSASFWLVMPLILLWYLLFHPTRPIGEAKGVCA